MIDVALYGHLTFDLIIGDVQSGEVGGIANVWRSLVRIDSSLHLKVCPLMIGSSRISMHNNFKKNISNLNQFPVKPLIIESKISHIAYINELPDPEFVFQISGFLTGDICTTDVGRGSPLKKEIADKFDVIFVSKEDLSLVPDSFSNRLVVHAPTHSTVYNSGRKIAFCQNPEDYLEDINVLGAGDFFAACYIYKLLKGSDDATCTETAQRLTSRFLRERHAKALIY